MQIKYCNVFVFNQEHKVVNIDYKIENQLLEKENSCNMIKNAFERQIKSFVR